MGSKTNAEAEVSQTSEVTSDEASEQPAQEPVEDTDVQAETPEAPATDPAVLAAFEAKVAEAVQFLTSIGATVTFGGRGRTIRTSSGERVTMEKADPDEVREFFEKSGLDRKQLAEACEVTGSVISTVQNPNGDRWSVKTFEIKKAMIIAYRTALAARLAAPLEETESEETEEAGEQAA